MADLGYRWVGEHAREFSIGDNRPQVEPGGFIDLKADDIDAEVQELIDTGQLIDIKAFNEAAAETEKEEAAEEKAAQKGGKS
jgi:hypothetical protein